MSKQATEFQKKSMAGLFRGKGIFKPLNTGHIDEHVTCIREYVANICTISIPSFFNCLPSCLMSKHTRRLVSSTFVL